MYTDDLILFVRPEAQDLQLIRDIFTVYVGASGLVCNPAKC
jgi:hypothetical protein